MSVTQGAAFRATVTATGFVLDVPLIGPAEAAERAMASWQDGAELRRLPDGRWLFMLAEPVEIRADRAPGLPVVRTDGGAPATLGADATAAAAGHLAVAAGGMTVMHRIAELAELDPAGWLDLSGLTLHRPRPVGVAEPEAEPVVESLPRQPRTDLRAAAGIGPRSERARRLTEDAPAGTRRRAAPFAGRTRPFSFPTAGPFAFAAAVLLVVLPLLVVASQGSALHVGVLLLAFAVGPAAAHFRKGGKGAAAGPEGSAAGAGTGGSTSEPERGRSPGRARRPLFDALLARLTMRTAGPLVQGRHARYLRELTAAFEQRRWEDALRDAIRLTGGRPAEQKPWLALGLPRRYEGALRPTPQVGGSGAASPLSGPTVHQHLAALYQRAAEGLEREGRIDEAAFVLADLRDAPAEAVALLVRHGRTEQAAELAEGRDLAADLVVRLWWQAGERERAVRTAYRRTAFAPAVERLAADDPASARELRAAWAAHRRESGDRLGAAEVLWADESLRPSAVADLRDAVALGGPTRSRALPYLLALGAGESTRALALAVLDSDGDPAATGRSALAAALAELPAADPAADRELATAAARAVVRDGGFGGALGGRDAGARHQRLLKRADPLVAADLARPHRAVPAAHTAAHIAAHIAADRPGTLPVLDAALLGSGAVLVACGQAGVRLLTADGRTKARWDVPADQLVLADHGGAALLVAGYGRVREVSRLDLATRSVRPWTTLRARQIVPSFDGRHLITADDDGITVLDTLAPRPTVVWRELGGDERLVGRLARTPAGCTGVVVSPLPDGTSVVELWRWDLPGWELRSRIRPEAFHPGRFAVLASGSLLAVDPQPADGPPGRTGLHWITERPITRTGVDPNVEGLAPQGPIADGDHWALAVPGPDGTGVLLHTGVGAASAPTATVFHPQADAHPPGFRRHADAVTHWHRSGRVLATTPDGATLLANLRVTVD
ncbi:bpX6 domain-containing protein [Streptomyces virginiae]|uniref:bpX6 domain-containing protein n=1 Tax=Streptomyces virginiae TaxID=1961 RepID=UPI00225764EF|nr:bpX6 domain-containing protein [Streptomyces virginiae]MCX4957215.1 bpX6 domain-containing protein [Streptomyces virginiae]